MASTIPCDLAIVGGGLAGGLLALALKRRRPDLDVRLVEAGETLGGNHVWSFFGADIAPADQWLVARLVAYSWPGYRVRFPGRERALNQPYYSITSEHYDAAVRAALPPQAVMTGRRALGVSATAVVLADGDRIEAKGVVDARGAGDLTVLDLGWQKFTGRELALSAPHGLDRPIVMDGSVEQIDGFRFVYSLPFGERSVFVEDTYYSDTAKFSERTVERRIEAYAAAQGWQVASIGRGEAAALPVALGGNFQAYWRSGSKGVAKAGVRAGLFHPTTGYSLPDAVRTAVAIAGAPDLSGAALHELTYARSKAAWEARGFYRLLDRMLFRAADPAERWRVLARFYTLAPGLIGRFYAGRSTMADKARILWGRPPVPIARAIRAVPA